MYINFKNYAFITFTVYFVLEVHCWKKGDGYRLLPIFNGCALTEDICDLNRSFRRLSWDRGKWWKVKTKKLLPLLWQVSFSNDFVHLSFSPPRNICIRHHKTGAKRIKMKRLLGSRFSLQLVGWFGKGSYISKKKVKKNKPKETRRAVRALKKERERKNGTT